MWVDLLLHYTECGHFWLSLSDAKSSNTHYGIRDATLCCSSQLSGSGGVHSDHLFSAQHHIIGYRNTCIDFLCFCECNIANITPPTLSYLFLPLFQSVHAAENKKWKTANRYGKIALYLSIANWSYVFGAGILTVGLTIGLLSKAYYEHHYYY